MIKYDLTLYMFSLPTEFGNLLQLTARRCWVTAHLTVDRKNTYRKWDHRSISLTFTRVRPDLTGWAVETGWAGVTGWVFVWSSADVWLSNSELWGGQGWEIKTQDTYHMTSNTREEKLEKAEEMHRLDGRQIQLRRISSNCRVFIKK